MLLHIDHKFHQLPRPQNPVKFLKLQIFFVGIEH